MNISRTSIDVNPEPGSRDVNPFHPEKCGVVNRPIGPESAGPATKPGPFPLPVSVCSQPFRNRLVEAWVEMVRRHEDDFAWFATFTFRPNERVFKMNRKVVSFIHPESAEKGLRRLVSGLNKEIFGKRYKDHPHEGIVAAVAWERQKSGNPHAHVLAGNIPDHIRRMDVVDRWFEKQGIARVEQYQKGMGAEQYLAKMAYLFKAGHAEIDLLGPWGQMQKFPAI